jgi:hypothetical protein
MRTPDNIYQYSRDKLSRIQKGWWLCPRRTPDNIYRYSRDRMSRLQGRQLPRRSVAATEATEAMAVLCQGRINLRFTVYHLPFTINYSPLFKQRYIFYMKCMGEHIDRLQLFQIVTFGAEELCIARLCCRIAADVDNPLRR